MNVKRIYVKRMILALLIGFLFGAIVTEIPIFFMYKTARAPQEIVLDIPEGTANLVARGEQPPTIPQDLTLVLGDTLVIKNEDTTDHQLGQLWVPANSVASLHLNQAADLVFECSFQPDKLFGIDVRQPLTLSTHLSGILGPGLTLGVMLALYSLLLPIKGKEHASA
ncbi:MAG: hypothetical protein OZ914_06900 [Anaerolineaceae bacterium]|jgi:hypothetical protein|nr:hypothetical protein [Anaerolineaceae bacterium]OQY91287.1 MAG: hypothetical protein B6D38_01415 [Anaerolineae bacterium UTCFX1]GJQ52358.1 MAG: hypothetical protein HKUEN02_12050 [Anaerolineaceae bacterium]